jgi:cell division protease FtsH
MDKRKRNYWLSLAANALLGVALIYILNRALVATGPKEVPYSEFLAEVRAGHLAEVQITDKTLVGVLKGEKPNSGNATPARMLKATRLPAMDEATLLKELDAHEVKFSGRMESSSGWLYALASRVLPLLIMAGIYRVGIQRMGQAGGPLTFSKNRAKIHDQAAANGVTMKGRLYMPESKQTRVIAAFLAGKSQRRIDQEEGIKHDTVARTFTPMAGRVQVCGDLAFGA